MSSNLGAAVVGTGFGVITHARALAAAGIEVRALVGRDPDKTAARAELSDIPFATTDRAEAFARDDIDVVAVTTPPHTHAEIVLDAVAAGEHPPRGEPFARAPPPGPRRVAGARDGGAGGAAGADVSLPPRRAQPPPPRGPG